MLETRFKGLIDHQNNCCYLTLNILGVFASSSNKTGNIKTFFELLMVPFHYFLIDSSDNRSKVLTHPKLAFLWFNKTLSIHLVSHTHRFTPSQGLVLYPQIGDKMDIVCPRADAFSGEREEFYRVYLVSRSQMESCTIDKTDTPLLNCDKPHRDVKFTFKFQEFSPNLWGLEFLKGRDYYITCESTVCNRTAHVHLRNRISE